MPLIFTTFANPRKKENQRNFLPKNQFYKKKNKNRIENEAYHILPFRIMSASVRRRMLYKEEHGV